MEGNIKIVLIEPDDAGTRHDVWAQRRDISGFAYTESEAVTAESETVFRIKDFGPKGLRPDTDWRIVDTFDENREYRIRWVKRVIIRGNMRSTYFDLYGSYRGVEGEAA